MRKLSIRGIKVLSKVTQIIGSGAKTNPGLSDSKTYTLPKAHILPHTLSPSVPEVPAHLSRCSENLSSVMNCCQIFMLVLQFPIWKLLYFMEKIEKSQLLSCSELYLLTWHHFLKVADFFFPSLFSCKYCLYSVYHTPRLFCLYH